MIKIYFIRHGESLWNKSSKVQGALDIPLSDRGKREASLIGQRMLEEKIDVVYASDLSRAIDTAKEISSLKGLDVNILEDIREMSFGDWEGKSMDVIKLNRKEELERWIFTPEKQKFKGGESLEDVQVRTRRALDKIISRGDKNIAIVSHSVAIKVMILDLLGIPLEFYKNMSLGNVSLSLVEIRDFNNVLVKYNDRNHLKEMEYV